MTRPYFENARAAVVVCDVTRLNTLAAVRDWKKDIDEKLVESLGKKQSTETATTPPTTTTTTTTAAAATHADWPIPVIIVANKSDLVDDGSESGELGARLNEICRHMNFRGWFIASAKDGDNMDEAMAYVVEVRRATVAM
jgi:predicted GTPase